MEKDTSLRKAKKKRCSISECKEKKQYLIVNCRCKRNFCLKHLHQHECDFDYKSLNDMTPFLSEKQEKISKI